MLSEESRKERIVEALLFAAGEPVAADQIAAVLETGVEEARGYVEKLMAHYQEDLRGMQILRIEDRYQMTTRPDYYESVRKLYKSNQKVTLSETQLETLSIIAYKQPVTKQEIEDIRGVRSDAVVNRLMEYNLVTEKGRKKAPGRPILLGTTEEFLRAFQLQSLKDLPYLKEPESSEEVSQMLEDEEE